MVAANVLLARLQLVRLLTMSSRLDRYLNIVLFGKREDSDDIPRRSDIHCVGWQVQNGFSIESTKSKSTLWLSNHANPLCLQDIDIVFLANVRVGFLFLGNRQGVG